MRGNFVASLACSLLLWTSGFNDLYADDAAPANDAQPSQIARLDQSIRLAAAYLSRATLPNGEFIYLANPDPRFKSPVEYHVVRHAAVMAVFSNYLQQFDDPVVIDAWQRASAFLNKCCIASVPGQEDQLAVWSLPQLHQSDTPLEADLGATGLALVGLAGLESRSPGTVDIEGLRALGHFILSMQDEDGRFAGKFTPEKGGKRDAGHTLYYPGEAVLGLLALYELDHASQWLESSIKAMTWLFENQPADDNKNTVDHWTLIAAGKLMAVTNGQGLPFERTYLDRHIVEISEDLLGDYQPHVNPLLRGAVYEKGYTTPTATRLEGLLATVDLLPASEQALREQILAFAHDGIDFLLRAQIRSGPFSGGVPSAMPGEEQVKVNRSDSEVRIDFVQHAMAAWLTWRQHLMLTE